MNDKKLKWTPIVALSANHLKDIKNKMSKYGLDEAIQKPISKDKIREALRTFVE